MTDNNSEPPVIIYTTVFCPYCHGAKRLLEEKGIRYKAIDLSGRRDMRELLLEKTGKRSIPQILIYGKPIGGYIELMYLAQSGRLEQLIDSESGGNPD